MVFSKWLGIPVVACWSWMSLACQARVSALATDPGAHLGSVADAKWTVMVYMNAKNNLDPYSVVNFEQMTRVTDSNDVHIVVEWGRDRWKHAYRIKVHNGMSVKEEPVGGAPRIEDIGDVDMGSVVTIDSFVKWSVAKYPAQHYALVIWDHGSGYRLELTSPSDHQVGTRLMHADWLLEAVPQFVAPDPARPGRWQSNYRAISDDEHTKHHLYNSDVQAVVEGSPVDILGFDACLMSMVETAYAVRRGAKIMVGSEELEPGFGWKYDAWLGVLVGDPGLSPQAVGEAIVDAYEAQYGGVSASPEPTATLACTLLGNIEGLAASMSRLSDVLALTLDKQGVRGQVRAARERCWHYAPCYVAPDYGPLQPNDPAQFPRFNYVDLGAFCDGLDAEGNDATVRQAARETRTALDGCLGKHWEGDARKKSPWSAHGISVYFPLSGRVYENDRANPEFGQGYERDNKDHPVEFVQKESVHWTDFLHKYFATFPQGVPVVPPAGCQ